MTNIAFCLADQAFNFLWNWWMPYNAFEWVILEHVWFSNGKFQGTFLICPFRYQIVVSLHTVTLNQQKWIQSRHSHFMITHICMAFHGSRIPGPSIKSLFAGKKILKRIYMFIYNINIYNMLYTLTLYIHITFVST